MDNFVKLHRVLSIAALVITVGATVYWLAVPVYDGITATYDRERRPLAAHGVIPPPESTATRETRRATLMEINGAPHTLLVLSVPLAISVLPLISGKATKPAAVCMLGFAFISGFSVGFSYIPSTILLLFAATVQYAHKSSSG